MLYNQQEITELLGEVSTLIGAAELKRYLGELAGLYDRLSENCLGTLYERAILMSIGEGDGLDTWLSRIAACWRLILDMDSLPVKYYQLKLPDLMDAGDVRKTSGRDIVLHAIEEDGILESLYGRRLLCVDITRWIDNVDGPEFRAVLSRLRLSMDEQFVCFRIPAVDEVTLRRVKGAISWFMNVDELYCPPYKIEDYAAYAEQRLKQQGIILEDGVEQMLAELIQNERRDRNFCGFKTVRCLVDNLVFKVLREQCGENAVSERGATA